MAPDTTLDQYFSHLSNLSTERNEVKAEMAKLAARLKEINEELDGEKTKVNNIRSLMTATRKRKESKAAAEVDPTTGEPIIKKRGRKPKVVDTTNTPSEQ